MAGESVMDAVNAALSGNNPPDEPADEVVADEVPDTGANEGALANLGDAATDEQPEGEVEETAEGEVEGEVEQAPDLAAEAELLGVSKRRADGTFKSKEQFEADVAAAKAAETAKAGTKAPGSAAAKTPVPKKAADAINDPIPADLKQETQQRIRTLIDRTKGAEEKAAETQQNFDYLVQGVQATGASPEQYGETLSWLSLFNSGDPKQQASALEIIEDVADRLATMLGTDRKVADPLAAHLDLQAAVKGGQITQQLAKEMARQRNQGAFRQELTQAQSQRQQQQNQAAQEKETARVDLNTLEESLRASDPLYDKKRAAIMPTLKVMFPQLPPSKWKDTFTKLYREARVATAQPIVRRTPVNQPLRANKGAGAGTAAGAGAAQPKSAMDVINAALGSMK